MRASVPILLLASASVEHDLLQNGSYTDSVATATRKRISTDTLYTTAGLDNCSLSYTHWSSHAYHTYKRFTKTLSTNNTRSAALAREVRQVLIRQPAGERVSSSGWFSSQTPSTSPQSSLSAAPDHGSRWLLATAAHSGAAAHGQKKVPKFVLASINA